MNTNSSFATDSRFGRPKLNFWRIFWLSFLVISLAYSVYCFYVPPNNVAWAKDYSEAKAQAVETDKPMILFFTGKWCVPCRIMKRQVWADSQVTTQINDQFVPVSIDVGDPKNAALLDTYKVQGPPVTMVTDPAGNVRAWRAGSTGKSEFLELLSEGKSSRVD